MYKVRAIPSFENSTMLNLPINFDLEHPSTPKLASDHVPPHKDLPYL